MTRYTTDSIDEIARVERAIDSVDLDRASGKYDFAGLATEISDSLNKRGIDILIVQFEGAYLAGYLQEAHWFLGDTMSSKCAWRICAEVGLHGLTWWSTIQEYLLACYHFGTEDADEDEELRSLQKG